MKAHFNSIFSVFVIRLKNGFRISLLIVGFISLLMLTLAFTRLPFDAHRRLGEQASGYRFTPDVIVMMGGSGMPSESNLIRLYYVAGLAAHFPDANIIIAHPIDSVVSRIMHDHLVQNGVDSSKINLMLDGTNTREQALELKQNFPGIEKKKVVIVTSPENMYRTIRVFRKLNYMKVGGQAAFENAMFVNLNYNHRKLGGKTFVPDISENLNLRYNFWNYLKLEIICLREYAAIIYYKMNGWI